MVKNLSANAKGLRDVGSILGPGRSPGVGNNWNLCSRPPEYASKVSNLSQLKVWKKYGDSSSDLMSGMHGNWSTIGCQCNSVYRLMSVLSLNSKVLLGS